jgi:hypothetical protein
LSQVQILLGAFMHNEWEKLSKNAKLSILANASTVDSSLLMECEPLVKAIKDGERKEFCLKIINENF